jgi:hypothetical protein
LQHLYFEILGAMVAIVISYRREDTKWIVGRIFDRLENHFGPGHVFIDIDNIPPGSDFRDHLQQTLAQCDILLVVIGPNWQGKSESNQPRLHDVNDWVRVEIAAALTNNVSIIPLLIDDTRMPDPAQLPEDIRAFAFRQAQPIDSGGNFRSNLDRLIRSMDRILISRQSTAYVDPTTAVYSSESNNRNVTEQRNAAVLLDEGTKIHDVKLHTDQIVVGKNHSNIPGLRETPKAPVYKHARARIAILKVVPVLVLVVFAALGWMIYERARSTGHETNTADLRPLDLGATKQDSSPSAANIARKADNADLILMKTLVGRWCIWKDGQAGAPTAFIRWDGGRTFANGFAALQGNSIVTTQGRNLYMGTENNRYEAGFKVIDNDRLEASFGPGVTVIPPLTYARC